MTVNSGNIKNVYIFSIVAVFILLIACFNFINLTTARSAERAKEVGIRKVVGAGKPQLTRQFIGESVFNLPDRISAYTRHWLHFTSFFQYSWPVKQSVRNIFNNRWLYRHSFSCQYRYRSAGRYISCPGIIFFQTGYCLERKICHGNQRHPA